MPLLFIAYLNDLPKICNCDFYADDSTIHCLGKSIKDVQPKVQEDLNELQNLCL